MCLLLLMNHSSRTKQSKSAYKVDEDTKFRFTICVDISKVNGNKRKCPCHDQNHLSIYYLIDIYISTNKLQLFLCQQTLKCSLFDV